MRSITLLAVATLLGAACATSSVEPRTSARPHDGGPAEGPGTHDRWNATLIAVLADADHRQVAGSASMSPGAQEGTTVAMVYILGGTPLRTHPWSVRRGRCGADAGPLSTRAYFEPLVVGSDGESASSATLDLHTPAAGSYYVAVYSASTDMETVIACGNLEPPLP